VLAASWTGCARALPASGKAHVLPVARRGTETSVALSVRALC